MADRKTAVTMLTDEQVKAIEERHLARKQYRDHIPGGPYYYDSLGYVHNERAVQARPAARQQNVGVLVRSDDWFKSLDMDAMLTNADKTVAPDLGQYLAMVCDEDVESDIASLLGEVRHLRRQRGA